MLKNAGFYIVAGTIIALIGQAIGASMAVVILSSLLGPPLLLLIVAIIRYNRIG